MALHLISIPADVAELPITGGQQPSQTVRRLFGNALAALTQTYMLSEEDAVGLIADAALDFLVPHILRLADNPDAEARDVCRELLSRVAVAQRGPYVRAERSGLGDAA